MLLEARVVLVSGAARGLGRAIAEACLAAGASVMLADRDQAELEATAQALDASGARAAHRVTDVTDESAVAALVQATLERFGRLDAAINNAGILGPLAPFWDLSLEDFDRINQVNLYGIFYAMKHELLHFRKVGAGAIVNVASVNGLVGSTNCAAYSASKHGVLGLTRSAALDVASLGIRVNALCPGAFGTEMLRTSQGQDFRAVLARAPMQRVGQPSELGGAAVFLCSDQASYLTGQTLVVDGGVLA